MAKTPTHTWTFATSFRRHAFGWRSETAIRRVKEAVAEIKKAAKADPALAAEGALVLLECLVPAIERVDGSSGSMSTAVNNAIAALAPILTATPAAADLRAAWLERLWAAYREDRISYLEPLGERWGELCVIPELASRWADRTIEGARMGLSPDRTVRGDYKTTVACLSALFAAGRYSELLALLEGSPYKFWPYHQFGARALAAMERTDEAIQYAESSAHRDDCAQRVAGVCEGILRAAGRDDDAYRRFGLLANRSGTYLAWFRAVRKKYPGRPPAEVLRDLVAFTPGEEGKWFAAARSAGLYDEAIALAKHAPCAPQTLSNAARDLADGRPEFAIEAGVAALRWLTEGYGYDITNIDVERAYEHTMKAASRAGRVDEVYRRIRELVANESAEDRFVTRVLGRTLGLG